MQEIEHELRTFIVENFLFGRPGKVGGDTSLVKAGIIDSTGVLELVTFLETRYGIEVKDEELIPENLDSISNLKKFLSRKLNHSMA